VLTSEQTAQLVEKAKRGDPSAFSELVRAYLRAAYAIGLAILGRPSDAEDVAQDALLIAFERIDSCREPERFAAWMLQIVRNQARNALKSRKLRDVPSDTDTDEPSDDAPAPDANAFRSLLLRALNRLSNVQREVLLLHDLEGWTHAEVAASLGTSELMSRQHLFLARRAMRDQLSPPSRKADHG